jgi:hypothetical protein
MNFRLYLEKLQNSEEFKNFMEANPNAFLCSSFFVIDKTGNDNKIHFDYFVNGKLFSFQLEQGIQLVPIETINNQIPEKINECDFDFEEVEKMIVDKMKEQGIKNKIQKILLSLQSKDRKCFLIGTVFVSSLGMLKINIDLTEMKITDFEKKSFFDIMKRVK